jgi:hypothetical protein
VKPPLREVLTVIRDGLQVPGITFYGLSQGGARPEAVFPDDFWPTGTEYSTSWLGGVGWSVLVWDLALPEWSRGPVFRTALVETFSALQHGGCVIAWIGREGYFCDPPQLFLPECMSGGILAACGLGGKMWADLDPEMPLSPLPDSVLLELRAASTGLADVGS